MDSYNSASSAELLPAWGAATPDSEFLISEPIEAASPACTCSIYSDCNEGNEMEEYPEDDEALMEPPVDLFNFLDVEDEEPEVAPQEADQFIFDENNVRIELGAQHYTHPIQELVADSEPGYAHQWQWIQGMKPGYSEVPTMPWNHTRPGTQYPLHCPCNLSSDSSTMTPCSSFPDSSNTNFWSSPAQYPACPASNGVCHECQIQAHRGANLASMTEAEKEACRRRDREVEEELFDMVQEKWHDRETYFA
ncbi:hypothetical protein E2P81_ATG01883 [Venturia nashicola]|uniref:Uncharacterized protein n=1 Tax=Venturia nashicola TaxID=86259 RepID=A0A4Z1PK76_9PEZI|nr:hypothetical protein E6O75_ATG01926 [Venturia nashicola]TLD35580.1 hypothetical protein E2P81_ATG01883 [Venturia nashicola]